MLMYHLQMWSVVDNKSQVLDDADAAVDGYMDSWGTEEEDEETRMDHQHAEGVVVEHNVLVPYVVDDKCMVDCSVLAVVEGMNACLLDDDNEDPLAEEAHNAQQLHLGLQD